MEIEDDRNSQPKKPKQQAKDQPIWYWKSNEDPWIKNEREKWTVYNQPEQ